MPYFPLMSMFPGSVAARLNPLHEPSRVGPEPPPAPPSFEDWPDASAALLRRHYANAEGSNLVSFAGGYLEDLTLFHSSSELGQVDLQPHGLGHVETGGFMASFFTAGLDPVFWMHHANVDRLWETYAHDLEHGYPFTDGPPAVGLAAEAFDSWNHASSGSSDPTGTSRRGPRRSCSTSKPSATGTTRSLRPEFNDSHPRRPVATSRRSGWTGLTSARSPQRPTWASPRPRRSC